MVNLEHFQPDHKEKERESFARESDAKDEHVLQTFVFTNVPQHPANLKKRIIKCFSNVSVVNQNIRIRKGDKRASRPWFL